MKKLLLLIGMLVMLTGFSSCESDETIFDRIVGRVWIGNLGFTVGSFPLESGVYFRSDGFGEDELCYSDTGAPYRKYSIQWSVDNNTIYINYGNMDRPRELRHVYVGNNSMNATLFVDGYEYGPVTLYMQ